MVDLQEFFEQNKRIIIPVGVVIGGLALYSVLRRKPTPPPPPPGPGGEQPPAPPSVFTVVLDPGHGGKDPGAVYRFGTIFGTQECLEKVYTLWIANLAASQLERRGIRVVQTRKSDVTVSLDERVKAARNANANVFVSIHLDSVPERTYYQSCSENHVVGLYSSINPRSAESRRLVELIAPKVADTRGVTYSIRSQKVYVLDYSPCPAALIEIGFICNQWFIEKLTWSYAYREAIAKAIADGIIEFLGTPY